MEQTASHHADNAYVSGAEIHNDIGKSPNTVEAVKTGMTEGVKNTPDKTFAGEQAKTMTPVALESRIATEYHTDISNAKSLVQDLEKSGAIRLNEKGVYEVVDAGQYQSKVSEFVERNGVVQVQSISHDANIQGGEVVTPIIRDGSNIRTAEMIQTDAENRVLTQTERYHASSVLNAEKTDISSQIDKNPNVGEHIKTGEMGVASKGDKDFPLGQHQQGVNAKPIGGANSPFTAERDTEGIPIALYSKNIRTTQDIANAAQERTLGNVKELQSGKTVHAIDGIQTGGVVSTRNGTAVQTALSIQSDTGERGLIPVVGVGRSAKVEMSEDALAEIKMTLAKYKNRNGVDVDTAVHGNDRENPKVTLHLNGKQLEAARAGKELAERVRTGTQTTREYVRGLRVVASYEVKTEAVRAFQKWKQNSGKKELLTGGKMLLANAEGSLMGREDLGDQSAGGVIAAGMMGYASFKGAQVATEFGINGIKKVGNGVYEVTTTAGKTAITVGRTAKTVIQHQVAPFSKEAVKVLKAQAINSGLDKTAIAKTIIQKTNAVKEKWQKAVVTVQKAKTNITVAARTVKTAVEKTVRVVHGVATGRMTVAAAYTSFNAFRNRAFAGIKTGLRKGIRTAAAYGVRGTAKAASVAVFRGTPTAFKLGRDGSLTVAGMMAHADDYALQGAGYAVQLSDVGIKTSVAGAKATGYTVKTAAKGGKKTYEALKFIKNHGLREAWRVGRAKAAQAISQAGKSIVSALIEGAKALGMKVLIPLLLIVCVGVAAMGGMNAPVMAVGAIFSGTFNAQDTNTEYDIRTFLSDPTYGVPALSYSYRQDLANQMQNSWNNYHIVRFYSNSGSGEVIDPTFAGVTSVFPTDEELMNMLQPIFNAIIVMDYELEPTEQEAKDLLETLFNGLFRVTTAVTTEQCGQALSDGQGTVTVHSCGEVHALADCPNNTTGTHSSWHCGTCDSYYYICKGHKGYRNCGRSAHSHDSSCYTTDEEGNRRKTCGKSSHSHDSWYSASNSGCYSTSYCNSGNEMSSPCGNCNTYFRCTGYDYCVIHDVISYTLTLDGAYALEARYFTDPINQLSSINPRTDEQEAQLQNLKDYYEIYLEIMRQVGQQYGGMSIADLSGVQFINGTRNSCQAVIDLALSQVGQQGGAPYWSYYGFSYRVEWCACFVHWCMRHTPSATNSYPTTANNAYCQTIANNFMAMGQWGDRTYTNLVAGDTIFFDWQGDGHTDHIGLVIGTDGTYVYTVEGNSGDAVKVKSYSVGSSVIYGYGLMNY